MVGLIRIRDGPRVENHWIIVTLHFIVSNGNDVVNGETVIRLITRYWKK